MKRNPILAAKWSNGEPLCCVVTRYGRALLLSSSGEMLKSVPLVLPESSESPRIYLKEAYITWMDERSSLAITWLREDEINEGKIS